MSAFLQCPVAACAGKRRSVDMLMCRSCWRQVPTELQREVYRTWRARQNAGFYDEEPIAAHEWAKEKAVAHLEGREPDVDLDPAT